MRFTDVKFVGWKKIGWAVFEKNCFFLLHFLGSPEIFLASKTLFGIRNLNGLKVENSIFWRNPPWESLKPLLGSKNLRSMIPLKVGVSDANLGFGGQKIFGEPQKMKKKLFFSKMVQPIFFPTNKSDISEPHGDLLNWNLSWAFTFSISVNEKGRRFWVWT